MWSPQHPRTGTGAELPLFRGAEGTGQPIRAGRGRMFHDIAVRPRRGRWSRDPVRRDEKPGPDATPDRGPGVLPGCRDFLGGPGLAGGGPRRGDRGPRRSRAGGNGPPDGAAAPICTRSSFSRPCPAGTSSSAGHPVGDALVGHPFCSLSVPARAAREHCGPEVLSRRRDASLEPWAGGGVTTGRAAPSRAPRVAAGGARPGRLVGRMFPVPPGGPGVAGDAEGPLG